MYGLAVPSPWRRLVALLFGSEFRDAVGSSGAGVVEAGAALVSEVDWVAAVAWLVGLVLSLGGGFFLRWALGFR